MLSTDKGNDDDDKNDTVDKEGSVPRVDELVGKNEPGLGIRFDRETATDGRYSTINGTNQRDAGTRIVLGRSYCSVESLFLCLATIHHALNSLGLLYRRLRTVCCLQEQGQVARMITLDRESEKMLWTMTIKKSS
jgi:hypothetical protein